MTLGFGLLSAQRVPGDSRTWEDAYDEAIRLSTDVERLGYDSVWTTEHHFVDDGYMPSLLVTSAAIAAVTETISIGTGVILAPLHNPLRLAEDAATVQVISRGRLHLGMGLGWSATEFEAFGAAMSRRGAAMTDILQLLPKAWSGESFSFEGDVYAYPELAVRPAPATPIPMIIGGGVDAAVRRAARYADGFFSNASPKRFGEQIQVGLEEMERAGRDPDTFRWIHYSVMYPGPREEIVASEWSRSWKYTDMEASATRSGIAPYPEPSAEEAERTLKRIVGGSSEEIVDTLSALRERVGVPVEWVARSFFADLQYERQLEIASQLATEVMPFLPTG